MVQLSTPWMLTVALLTHVGHAVESTCSGGNTCSTRGSSLLQKGSSQHKVVSDWDKDLAEDEEYKDEENKVAEDKDLAGNEMAEDEEYTDMFIAGGNGTCVDLHGNNFDSLWAWPRNMAFSDCRDMCSADSNCLGFDFQPSVGGCELRFSDTTLPDGTPSGFGRWDQGDGKGAITNVKTDGTDRNCYAKPADDGFINFGALGSCTDSSGSNLFDSLWVFHQTYETCRDKCIAAEACLGFDIQENDEDHGDSEVLCENRFGQGDLPTVKPVEFGGMWKGGKGEGPIVGVVLDGSNRRCYVKPASPQGRQAMS